MRKPTIGSIQRVLAACAAAALALAAPAAQASFLEGEALDTMANVVSWFAITVVPIGVIWLFWMVLCLLSLVFGGLLWPLAWLWAYTKPSMYKLAYGTDRVDYHTAEATPEPAAEDKDAGRAA
jgi:hypothetical protein